MRSDTAAGDLADIIRDAIDADEDETDVVGAVLAVGVVCACSFACIDVDEFCRLDEDVDMKVESLDSVTGTSETCETCELHGEKVASIKTISFLGNLVKFSQLRS